MANPVMKNGAYAGEIRAFAFTTPPTGWIECDGRELSKSTYKNLHEGHRGLLGHFERRKVQYPGLSGLVPSGLGPPVW